MRNPISLSLATPKPYLRSDGHGDCRSSHQPTLKLKVSVPESILDRERKVVLVTLHRSRQIGNLIRPKVQTLEGIAAGTEVLLVCPDDPSPGESCPEGAEDTGAGSFMVGNTDTEIEI